MDLTLVALLVVSPLLLVLARIVFVPNGIGFEDLLRRTDLDWPRGVQEEEPVSWHVDRMHRHSRA